MSRENSGVGCIEQKWLIKEDRANRKRPLTKVRVMKLVEVVAGTGPLEAVMPEPRAHRAIHDAPHNNRGVAPESHRDQRRGVVPKGFV